MSITKNYYVIVGYDLTGWETDKYEEWKWTEEGEKYTCNQSRGHIQLFDDPMSGEHLYLGYVLAGGDQYKFETVKISISSFLAHGCLYELKHLIDIGVIDKNIIYTPESLNCEVIILRNVRRTRILSGEKYGR